MITVFSELAQSFTEEVKERVNTYFEQLYNHPPDPTLSIAEVIFLLKSLQGSQDKENRDVLAYMLYLLLEKEFKSLPLYPNRELKIAAQLLGEIIDNSIITHGALGIALQFILESLAHEPNSRMYRFGVTALARFKTKIKEYPQFCQRMLQIPHFMQLPRHLIERNPLANIKNFQSSLRRAGSPGAQNQSQAMANQALAPSGSSSKTLESIVQQLKLQKQGQEQLKQHQEQLKQRQHMQSLGILETILTNQDCLTKSDGLLKQQEHMQLKQQEQMQLKQQEQMQLKQQEQMQLKQQEQMQLKQQEQMQLKQQEQMQLKQQEEMQLKQQEEMQLKVQLKQEQEQQMQLKQMQLKQQEEMQLKVQLKQEQEQQMQLKQEQLKHEQMQLEQEQMLKQLLMWQEQEQLQQQLYAAVSENPEFYEVPKTFSRKVEKKASSFLQLVLCQPPTMAISEALHILKCLKMSPDQESKVLSECIVSSMLQQFKYLPHHPAWDLQLMAQLYGGIIDCDIANYWDLGVTLRYILDSLRLTPNYTMFHFGVLALDRFKHKLKNLSQFCQSLIRIPHISLLPPQLFEYVQYGARQCAPNP